MYIINLLLKKWYEPSSKQRYHFSTLVQQTLSVIGQYGGVRVDQLWKLLCETRSEEHTSELQSQR